MLGLEELLILLEIFKMVGPFSEPYYISNIEINNENGLLVDFGDQLIILDNTPTKGRITVPHGIHNIKIHKNNWVNISAGL